MSPDKVHTVTLAATTIYTTGVVGYEAAVTHALNLYEEASRQVRKSGPTSTEKKCKHGGGTICCDFDCPRHGHG